MWAGYKSIKRTETYEKKVRWFYVISNAILRSFYKEKNGQSLHLRCIQLISHTHVYKTNFSLPMQSFLYNLQFLFTMCNYYKIYGPLQDARLAELLYTVLFYVFCTYLLILFVQCYFKCFCIFFKIFFTFCSLIITFTISVFL